MRKINNQDILNDQRGVLPPFNKRPAKIVLDKDLQRILIFNPLSIKELSIIGLILLRDENHSNAAVYFKRCCIITPTSTPALNNIGNL